MDYKLILLVIVLLFIGANLMCSCCRYPIFDYIMGKTGSPVKEGMSKKDSGSPGSVQAVTEANKDIAEIMSKNQPTPPILNPPTKQGFVGMMGLQNGINTVLNAVTGEKKPEGFLGGNVFNHGLNVLTGGGGGNIGGSGPAPRDQKIPVNTTEGMATMGSDINEVQNGDVSGMWLTKANSYASDFGYGGMNNTGTSYSADEPLKNGQLVMFAKNKSKPECCPAPYSTSTGCICMTSEQINYLNTRGGNRTSDSGV
jgi:hypothetical protein